MYVFGSPFADCGKKGVPMKRAVLLILLCILSVSADLYVRKAPRWSFELPQDSGYIYGVGVATINGDVAEARKRAEQYALLKVAQSLKSVIVGRVKNQSGSLLKGDSLTFLDTYDEAISVFTEATLTECHIVEAAVVKKKNTYWVLASMSRAVYDKKVNAHFYHAKEIARASLEASFEDPADGQGGFIAKIRRLEQGLDAVECFWGVPMYAVVKGRKVLLNIALSQRVEELFAQLQVVPSTTETILLSKQSRIEHGVTVYWNGVPVDDVPLQWHADKNALVAEVLSRGGMYLPQLQGVHAGCGDVTITAEVDLNAVAWRLKRKGISVSLPSPAALTVRSLPKKVHVVFGADTRDFVNWLTESGSVELSPHGAGLELTLEQSAPKLKRGLYHVRSEAVMKIQDAYTRVERVSVTVMDRSGARALQRSKQELYKKLVQFL